MRLATYTAEGDSFYGAVTDTGLIALSPDFPGWPTLYDAVAAGGLGTLTDAARDRAPTHRDVTYEMVMPDAPRILWRRGELPRPQRRIPGRQRPAEIHVALPALCQRLHRP